MCSHISLLSSMEAAAALFCTIKSSIKVRPKGPKLVFFLLYTHIHIYIYMLTDWLHSRPRTDDPLFVSKLNKLATDRPPDLNQNQFPLKFEAHSHT